MEKKYQAKIYDFSGNYKMTINPDYILTSISFSGNINGGQGQLSLPTAYGRNYQGISHGDMIKVWVQDEDNPLTLIYTGNITRLARSYTKSKNTITVIAIGLFAFMNRLMFKSGGVYEFTKNQDPAQTIKDIIDRVNDEYTANRFGYSGVENYGSDINIGFDYDKCPKAIQDIQKGTASYYFFVGPDGDFVYKEKDDTIISHRLTLGKDVFSLVSTEDIESVINEINVKTASGGYVVVNDSASIAEYGLIENKIETSAQDAPTATIIGSDIIEENKDFKKQTVLIVNSEYNIESINPGDYVKIQNSEYELGVVQILKTQYTFDKLVCYLDKYTTATEEISFINKK